MTTQATQTIVTVNSILSLASTLNGIALQIAGISSLWTNLSMANKVNAMPTTGLTVIGDLGAPDQTPNVANPIDTRTLPTITHALSANDIAGLLTWLQGVQTVINGGSVSANGAAAQLIAKCL
jgi:hypothetical protein